MATYNQNTNWDNERTYLNNLIAGGGGNAEWAKGQMNELNAAEAKYGGNPSTGTTSGGSSSGGSSSGGSSSGGSSSVGSSSGGSSSGGSSSGGSSSGGSQNSYVADLYSGVNNKAEVTKLQTELKNLGYYSGAIDGSYGPQTTAAVTAYQKANGLTVDGKAGQQTQTKLYGASSGGGSSGGSSSGGGSSGGSTFTPVSGTSSSGQVYNIGTETGVNWINNAAAGQSERMNDGSVWTKNSDGSVTIAKNGVTYSVAGPATSKYGVPVTKTVTSGGGNRSATVTYFEDGTTSVVYDDKSKPVVGDYIDNSNGTLTFYVDDEESGAYWYTGSVKEYNDYVASHGPNSDIITQLNAQIEALQQDFLERQQAVNQAAVDMSVQEIEANLENGLEDYSQSAAETYLKMLKAQQNQQLRNAAAGDLGGIGQKQYNDATAQYDAALLQIDLEREAFVNSCNQQIEQLKAQGRLQDAQILADWAQTKLEMYNENYKWYQEMLLQKQQIDYNQSAADREYYFNRAVGMLEKGILTGDALTALGISEADARNYAAMLNEEAAVSLAYAKAQLNNLYQKSAGTGGGTPTTEQTDGNPNDIVTWYSTDAEGNAVPHTMFRSEAEGLVQDGWFTVDEYGNPLYYNAATGELESQEGRDRRVSGETAQANEREIGARLSTWYSKYSSIGKGNNASELYNSLSNRMKLLYNDIQAQEQEVQNRRDEAARDPSATNKKWNIKVAESRLLEMKQEYDRYAAAIEEYNSLAR